jgi:hypothetical protein
MYSNVYLCQILLCVFYADVSFPDTPFELPLSRFIWFDGFDVLSV